MQVLRAVGLMEVRDEDALEGPPDNFLCDGLDPFRMQDYQQETDTYEPFKERLEVSSAGLEAQLVIDGRCKFLDLGHISWS